MRIACVYLPSFPLQAHVRQAPHLAGTSLVVADSATGATVVACSRAAWADGIRLGMAVATARTIAPELEVVAGERELYERAFDAVVESLMACSEVIDAGALGDPQAPHRVIYVQVPSRSRGASFGQKLLTQLSRQGFRGRVGVADDRFTAYVAAVRVEHRGQPSRIDQQDGQPPLFHQSCTVVPRGGSAGYLAPLPLSYLPIDSDVLHLLDTCGIKTLGDFAELPPPSVSRDWLDEDCDFQALARGHGPVWLRGQSRDAVVARPLVERIEMRCEPGEPQPLASSLRALCDHASQRLEGRGRRAQELVLRLLGPAQESARSVVLRRPTASGTELLEAVQSELMGAVVAPVVAPVVAIELEVTADTEPDAEPAVAELELFAAGLASQPVAAEVAGREAQAPRTQPHWPTRRERRPGRRRAAVAQQVLSFVE